MKVIENLNLKYQLILMVILPAIGLLYFADSEIQEARQVKLESQMISELAVFDVTTSALVHELQKERGASSGFIGSHGANFAKILPAQHQQTDLKIKALENLLSTFKAEKFGEDFQYKLTSTLEKLHHITQQRRNVLALNMPVQEVLKFYTDLNTQFIELASTMAQVSSNAEITREVTAYIAFLQSKERAGIERAVLSNTFSQNAFAPGMFNKFLTLMSIQNTYLDLFRTFATESQKSYLKDTLSGKVISETDRMRAVAEQNVATGAFNTDPNYWFDMQTQKINLLKKVEDRLAEDLQKKSQAIHEAADQKMLRSILLSLLIILTTLFIAFYFIHLILKQLGVTPSRLLDVVNEITAGNLSANLNASGNMTTGVFAAIQIMQKNLRQQIETDRRTATEMGRIKQALDNVESAVMVADTGYKIIYINKAATTLFQTAEVDLRRQLPNFAAAKLLGSTIDIFQVSPFIDKQMLNVLDGSKSSKLLLGGRHFDITINPVNNTEQGRIGIVIEWLDRTNEVLVEQQVANIVKNVKAGQLHQRIDSHDQQGFIQHLSVDMNELIETIEQSFTDISGAMHTIVKGDLSHKITNDYQGVYDQCKNDINKTLDQLHKVFQQISEASKFINSSAQELASGNDHLSQRAEQQAASLEQTASSMQELTSIVRTNSRNALKANDLSIEAREVAKQGGSIAHLAFDAMQEIIDSSRRIADIINVIDEIAFQTNLLALNASVEAAKAGEHGRGFSIVAVEVRQLAKRSAKAAHESKALIRNSVQKVNAGSEFVNRTQESLNKIVHSVEQVSAIVSEIAKASVEQASGIEEVNKAVATMDEITQQNAALAEQASAASASMSEQANRMDKLLNFFKL